jgi:vacuolar-type H+-ATPase subunit E/Vma4
LEGFGLNVKDKLRFFAKVITAEALNRREDVLRVIDKRMEKEVGEIRTAAEKSAERRFKLESAKIAQTRNRNIIAASRKEKRRLTSLRAELTARLFSRVTESLLAYTLTEEYRSGITRAAESHRGDHVQMLLTTRDVNSIFGGENDFIKASAKDFIGGFKLYNSETGSLEDHSFLTGLNKERGDFNALRLGDRGVV